MVFVIKLCLPFRRVKIEKTPGESQLQRRGQEQFVPLDVGRLTTQVRRQRAQLDPLGDRVAHHKRPEKQTKSPLPIDAAIPADVDNRSQGDIPSPALAGPPWGEWSQRLHQERQQQIMNRHSPSLRPHHQRLHRLSANPHQPDLGPLVIRLAHPQSDGPSMHPDFGRDREQLAEDQSG